MRHFVPGSSFAKTRTGVAGACVAVLTLAALASGCDRPPAPSAPDGPATSNPDAAQFAETLRKQVTADAMLGHLQKLQAIADQHNGNRAVGSPGYAASADYVAEALRQKGFDVQTPEFKVKLFDAKEGSVRSGAQKFTALPLRFSLGTSDEGLTANLVPAKQSEAPGCAKEDFDGLPVAGSIVLVDRGVCPFSQKMAHAVAAGAVGMIIANSEDEKEMGGTLGRDTDVKIPVVSISKADGKVLREHPGQVTVQLTASTRNFTTRNVIAQTKTGATDNVVALGAHLDSVEAGPGINDNGSGVAAVLETALQLGSSPPIHNAVRFAFWAAEEPGLLGSANYIQSLSIEQLKDIALYLNFDMLASPNPGYFTYDGNQSAPRDRSTPTPRVPEGSAGIERALAAYLNSAGKVPRDTSFDGRSDYDAFTMAGIPSGGLFAGAEDKMSAEEAELWGGQADHPFDENYHKATDTVAHIDRTALGIQGAGVGYIVGLYAQDLTGRNGVPIRTDRTRHVVTPE